MVSGTRTTSLQKPAVRAELMLLAIDLAGWIIPNQNPYTKPGTRPVSSFNFAVVQ